MPDIIPSSPDPEIVTLVAALLRHLLTLGSGLGIAVGTYSDSTLAIVASAAVACVTTGWSLWQKIKAAQQSHASVVASARTGVAQRVVG